MSRHIRIQALGVALLALVMAPTTSQADDPYYNTYEGDLTVEVTCTMPDFVASATMHVFVDRYMAVTIDPAEMNYGGTEDLEECTYTRTGTWNLAPTGVYLDGPPAHLDVNENITFSEHIVMDCPPPAGFEKFPSGVLDGHLAFDWVTATTGTDVIQATNPQGDQTRWTLFLIVNVPTETRTWSAVKLLYDD